VPAARSVLGLVFFVFGLDGFLHFIPTPDMSAMPEAAVSFSLALYDSGYMIQLVKGTELVAGGLLLANRFVPLALALLAPVVVNIVLYHAFLAPDGFVIAGAVCALELALAWCYRSSYAAMTRFRTTPA
jgi:hypothetical protein